MGSIYLRGKTWWIKYYRNGKPYRESAESHKETDAKTLLKKREGEIAQGKLPGIYFDRVKYDELEKDLKTDYALKNQVYPRVKHLRRFFEGVRATEIATARVKEFINARLKEGAANGTINRELSTLKRMFKLGAQETPPKVDRIPYIPMLEEDNVRERFLEPEEYTALIKALPAFLRPVVTFGYRTGWRKSEVLGLTWNRINLREGTVELEAGTTKNKKPRIIYLDDKLLPMLNTQNLKREKGCKYVFHRKGARIKDFEKVWNNACQKAGIGRGYRSPEGPKYHDLRRTAVRNLIRSGVGRDVAKRITGHKTDAVFSRYNITSPQDLKEASEKQSAYLVELGTK